MKSRTTLRHVLMAFAVILPSVWAQTDLPRPPIHCPHCGSDNAAMNKFCEACGSRMPVSVVAAKPSAADSNTITEIAAAARSEKLQGAEAFAAHALYEAAMRLVSQNNFAEAAASFRRIAQAYPESEYAGPSTNMARACEQLAQLQKKPQKTPVKAGPSNAAAFGGAFIGALAGTLGSVLVLIAIANGS